MSFSQFAGSAIVPTLSRIVLALAFVTTGYNKVMTQTAFTAPQARVLQNLGVEVTPSGVAAANPLVVHAAYLQDEKGAEPPEQDTGEDADAEGGGDAKPAEEPPAGPGEGAEVVVPADEMKTPSAPPADDGATFTARSLHQITLKCQAQGWPSPTSLAWAAALTELIGGALLLLGFLSRLWGLALAGTMCVAFYLESMIVGHVHTMSPFIYAPEIARFNTTFAQLGLCVLAFGVMCTGPGPVSVDRLLFRRGKGSGGRGILKPDEASVSKGRPM